MRHRAAGAVMGGIPERRARARSAIFRGVHPVEPVRRSSPVRAEALLKLDDVQVLQRAGSGDAAAFPVCVERFGPLVWTLARQLLADRTEAEDAVQDVLIELWRCADRYRGRLRQRQLRGMRSLDAADEVRSGSGLGSSAGLGSASQPANKDDARTAVREFDRLRPEQRDVIRLAVQAGWNHEQIAAHLSMPLGTVKTHLRRGILRIREALGVGSAEGEGTS